MPILAKSVPLQPDTSPSERLPCTCGPTVRECPACAADAAPPAPADGPVTLWLYGQPRKRLGKYRVRTIQRIQRLYAQDVPRREIVRRLGIPSSTVGYLKDIVMQPLVLACLLLPTLAGAETSVSLCAPQAVMPRTPPPGAVLILETCPTPPPVFGGQPLPPGDALSPMPGVREGEPHPSAPAHAPCVGPE